MHADGSQLLRQLEPAVRPGSSSGTGGPSGRPAGAGDVGSFDALLAQLMRPADAKGTGRPVAVDPVLAAEVQLPPGAEGAVSEAVDAAERAGARRALVLTGDQAYTVDVTARRIIGQLPQEPGRLDLERVDVAVSARNPEAEPALGPPTSALHAARINEMEHTGVGA